MNTNKVKRNVLENFILWYTSDENEREYIMRSVDDYIAEDHVNLIGSFFLQKSNAELILEEIYLHGDDDEKDPQYVYAVPTSNLQRPRIYSESGMDGQIRTFELTKDQDKIAEEHRDEILNYRLAKFTQQDEVSLGDIFMHMKFVKEVL